MVEMPIRGNEIPVRKVGLIKPIERTVDDLAAGVRRLKGISLVCAEGVFVLQGRGGTENEHSTDVVFQRTESTRLCEHSP